MTTWTMADLDALEHAIASGAQSVSYEGKSISYRSVADMMLARRMIRSALGLTTNLGTYVAAHDRGFQSGGSDVE